MLRGARSLSSRRELAIRCFSSSSGGPNFERGLDLAVGLWNRSYERLPKFEKYQDNGLFIDSVGFAAQCWLFIQLQLPKKTEVDLDEFVDGARVAIESKLLAMNSVEFPKFLAGEESNSTDVADLLQQCTTPAYYNLMALKLKKNYLHRNFYIDCENMKVEKAQLAQVVYRRLTEKEYADWVEFKKPPKEVSRGATVEHLRLHVDISTVEDLNIVYLEKETSRAVQQQNVYRVVFESRVTEPEEVDWRIADMHLIEQDAMQRPGESTANTGDDK